MSLILRIDIKDKQGRSLFGIVVNPDDPPSVVKSPLEQAGPLTLDWDQAMDDHQHLRRCPVCSCQDLYARKELPHVTSFVVLLFAALVAMVLFGFGEIFWAVVSFVVVSLVDLAILLFARRVLVCYQCLTVFRSVPIRRGHPAFDRTLAQSHGRG